MRITRERLQALLYRSRPGISLIELLLFVALMAFSGLVIVDLLLTTSDSQARQRTVSDVEQGGVQIAQLLEYEIHHAERILKPALQSSGSTLIMQMSDAEANPTLIGLATGSLVIIEKSTLYPVSDPQMTVSDFHVWNTSPSDSKPSARIMFTLTRRVPIPTLPFYRRTFDVAVTVFTDDVLQGVTCGTGAVVCASPSCNTRHSHWDWSVCNGGACKTQSGALVCKP